MGFLDTLGNVVGGFANGVGSIFSDTAGNAYSLLTGRPQDVNYNSTMNAASYNPFAKTPTTSTTKTPTTSTTKTSTSTPATNPEADYYAKKYALDQESLALQRAQTPKFINFDISGSWAKAKQMAEQAVSPIYQQKMTDFIDRQKTELEREQTDTVTGKSALDVALARLLGDTQVQRTRTGEDAATNIADINAAQRYASRGEGLNFDTANRALTEGLGASNMASSGIGQQKVTENQLLRRNDSNEQVRQSENKVEAQNTLMNRTFEDLTTKETQAGEDTATNKAKLDLDLERFIEDQTFNKDQEQKKNDLSMAVDIAQKTSPLQGQLVDQWLASLAGQGYSALDISNAASIYK